MKISEKQKTKTMAFLAHIFQDQKLLIMIHLQNKQNVLNIQVVTISKDVKEKLDKFSNICAALSRQLKNKVIKETQIKFYKTIGVLAISYGSEIWKNNKSKAKSKRNEISKKGNRM